MIVQPHTSPEERECPVCQTRMPDGLDMRRCPRCGARVLHWAGERPYDRGIVLFNARIGGLTAGAFVSMMTLLLLGYRFPLPWGVVLIALALPVAGYVLLGEGAQKVPPTWRTHYLVGVLALNAGLLAASMAAVIGLLALPALAGIVAAVGTLAWPVIRAAVTASAPRDDARA